MEKSGLSLGAKPMNNIFRGGVLLAAMAAAACGRPSDASLRDSFAQQVAANKFVSDFARSGDELTFSGPGPEGDSTKWRVHIDSAVIESQDDQANPYKGTVKSSWFADGQKIAPRGGESGLPFELLSNGVSQDAWAFWEKATNRWSWE